MDLKIVAIILIFGILGCKTKKQIMNNTVESSTYPETKKTNIEDDYFGTLVKDPFRWLEDEKSSDTKNWIDSQMQFTEDYLSKIPFRDSIKKRLERLVNYERFGVPRFKNGKYYMFKNSGLQNQSVFYEVDSTGKNIKVIIDPNSFSNDGTKALSTVSFSHDGKYLGYMVAESGADWNTAYVMDLETGKVLKDIVKWIKFSGLSWYKDGFFYSRYPESNDSNLSTKNTNHKLFYHKLGTSQRADMIWYEDNEHPNRNIYASTSEDERYLILNQVESTSGNSFSFIELQQNKLTESQIIVDFKSDFSFIGNIGENLFILTNRGTPNKKIIKIGTKKLDKNDWSVIVKECEDPIQSVKLISDKLIVTYLHNAYSLVKVFDINGKFLKELSLPGIGTVSTINGDRNSKKAFLMFSSFLFPTSVYIFDTEELNLKLFKRPKLDFDPEKYTTIQKWYKSKDSTKIPMFITYKKGLKFNKKNPTLLYGYGGFDISITPSFSASRLLFLEKNGIYAVANIRGGGEFGEKWHKAGTMSHKQNVFNDFIAAAEYLIENKYTSPDYLAIEGRSNGGLLIAATLLQRPDLFAVALPEVGVLDMLRYHKFTIGWAWAGDYGRSDVKEQFDFLIKYSPVHNVKRAKYPATLVITADHDDRVVPAHSFKFISELQSKQNWNKPVLIRIDKKSGHGAGKPLSKIIEELTDIYSFVFYNMKISF